MATSVNDLRRPFPRSYWVVPNRLLAGFLPSSTDRVIAERYRAGLVDSGIRYMLNLMEEDERDEKGDLFAPYQEELALLGSTHGVAILCERIGIRDMSIPSHDMMREILDRVDRALGEGPVYVHCRGGKGRTGTVIGCWLVRHGYAVGDTVLAMLDELRRPDAHGTAPSPETSEQRKMVRGWRMGW